MLMVGGLTALFGGALLLQHTLAAPGQFSITGAGSVQNGNNITVGVRVNPGTAIDTIDATLTYDQSKLQFVSVNSGGSAFPYELPGSGGGGSVSMVRFISPGTVSTDSLITQVTFKALVGSGTTNLQISGTGALVGVGTTPSNGSATITFTSPAPAPSPTPTPTPNPSTNPKPSPSPSPTPSGGSSSGGGTSSGGSSGTGGSGGSSSSGGTANNNPGTKPSIELDVQRRRIEYTKALFLAKAKAKFRMFIKYGLENQLVAQTPLTGFGTEHEVALDETVVLPGTKFYYQVIAEDEQGNKTEMPVESFKTKGYKIKMYLVDKYEKPLRNKKVVLRSDPIEAKTDENGSVDFEDVAPGNHTVEYEQGGKKYSQAVTITGQPIKTTQDGVQAADVILQQAVFKELAVVENRPSLLLPASIAAMVALIAAGAFVLVKRRQRFVPNWPGGHSAGPTQTGSVGTPPATPQDPTGNLVDKVSGLQKPDPGSIVSPNQNDKDKQ